MTKRATQHKSNTPVEWEQAEGFSRYLISTDGQVYSIDNDKILKPNRNSSGYVRGTGKKREKWPLVDVVSEFILFETMQMKPQISIRKYA